jgi:TolA-binding protein
VNGDLLVQLAGALGLAGVFSAVVNAITNRRKLRSESSKDDADATQIITTAAGALVQNLQAQVDRATVEITHLREEVARLREQLERDRDRREQLAEQHRVELAEERAARRRAEERADRHATSLAELARLVTSEAYRTAAADLLHSGIPADLGPLPEPDPEADQPELAGHTD